MTAVGRHFGAQVSVYSIWNEPNHPAFLLPQWNSNGTPASPRIYRALYQCGYAGLQAAGLAAPAGALRRDGADGLSTGSTAREGSSALLHDVAPLAFLREAPVPERPLPARRLLQQLQMSGYAHHAYTLPAGPVLRRAAARRRARSASLSRLSARSRPRRPRPRDPGARADLPHRVRRPEHPQPARRAGRQAGRVRRDRRAHRVVEPARRRASRSTCSGTTRGRRPGSSVHGGTVGFQTGLRAPAASPSRSTRLAAAADRQPLATALLAVGPRAPGDRRDEGDGLVRARARAPTAC